MSRTARRTSVKLNWKKYERKASIRLQSTPKKKKLKVARSNNQITLGITALFFLIALILVGKLFGFLGGLNTTITKNNQPKLYSWDGQSQFNLVVKMKDSYLLSYQPEGKELTVIKFPEDIHLNVPYDFGRWPMRSIYDLGQSESIPMGPQLLRDSINRSFDILADGYLIFNNGDGKLSDLLQKERGSLLPGVDILASAKTDLNLIEFFKIWWAIKEVREDKISSIDLEKSDLTEWLLLPDGSRVIALDEIKIDRFEEGHFETGQIKKDGQTIGIFNATEVPGLAEQAAKLLTNMGARVIFTANAPEKVDKSIILAKHSYTTKYLTEKLNLSCPQKKLVSFWQNIPLPGLGKGGDCVLDNVSLDTTRADITIILGEDTFLKYQK
ncbi:MAG: LytR C-terminal domain-containing protein [Candidatus Daviesbacteria bacterium]|nr:LytR C-terminal domain-containing protein [Candidatus Daviesbacteria bacterium]